MTVRVGDQHGLSPALAVCVIGYLRDTLGLAEAARLYVDTLAAGGIGVSTIPVAPDLPVDPGRQTITRFGDHPYEERRATVEPTFNLVCLNGDQLADLVRRSGTELLAGRPTIGQWAWETDVLPRSWAEGFQLVDEIWVNSTFVARNLARLSPVPVVVVPQAIAAAEIGGVQSALAADERFTFLFMLDFFSTTRRKNAAGLVEAFKRAFRPGEGPRLLIKTINAEFRPQHQQELRFKIGDRRDIELVDVMLGPREKTALLARADCYVSLHRSEGFGLTLAESMVLGTPVIATGYSGNMDFMTASNSYLVDWEPTHVGLDCDMYPPEGTWAEPDLGHAAEQMRRAWERPDEAQAKAARARQDIARRYAPEVAGRLARERLEQLRAVPPRLWARPDAGVILRAVERELAFDLRRGAHGRRGASAMARRALLRLMRPYTVHERKLDRALADAIIELRSEVDRLQTQLERAARQDRSLETRPRDQNVEPTEA